MYIPHTNEEADPGVILGYIETHPFGALVTAGAEGLFATHLPFVLDRSRGAMGVLQGHVARANPHHCQTLTGGEALVIFSGPDAYVSPSWYAAKLEHGKVVPTWNYVAVHVYGHLRFIEDSEYLRTHLVALTRQHEAGRDHPWSVDDAPEALRADPHEAGEGLDEEGGDGEDGAEQDGDTDS
jgi:transcriptional regulator